MKYLDQLNREFELNESPKRIVSLVPSQTELLVDLGLKDAIVGVTKFCVHPKHLRKEKIVVGGTKKVNINKIKALKPDIILCNKEENNKEIIDELTGVAPIHISDINNLNACLELIEMYGSLFDKETKANQIIIEIKKERQQFQQNVIKQQKCKVAYFIWKDPWMVAASDTFIDYMIREAEFENIFKNENRYPVIDLENPKLKTTDLIFLSSEPYPFKATHIEDFKLHFPNIQIHIVDGEMFSWYGTRLKQAYKYFISLKQKIKKSVPN